MAEAYATSFFLKNKYKCDMSGFVLSMLFLGNLLTLIFAKRCSLKFILCSTNLPKLLFFCGAITIYQNQIRKKLKEALGDVSLKTEQFLNMGCRWSQCFKERSRLFEGSNLLKHWLQQHLVFTNFIYVTTVTLKYAYRWSQ